MNLLYDCSCEDCGNLENGTCAWAAEALRLEGWPRTIVMPDNDADASACPCFAPLPTDNELCHSSRFNEY